MKRIRIIPSLLLLHEGLYKTIEFKKPKYIGDPVNTVKIFNEKGADEIVLLDIGATKENKPINFKKIAEIASEAFMPMAYGGGVQNFAQAQKIFNSGFEKVILNSAAFTNPGLISEIAGVYGSRSAVVSIDAKPNLFGKYKVYTVAGTQNTGMDPVEFAKKMEDAGAGELIINAIQRDGTWEGYDIPLIKSVSQAVRIPVIACGGASGMDDFKKAVTEGGASAVAAGSYFVYQKKGSGVLISFPSQSIRI
jgi:imidazole glycerol-phosphate synthase subunit HisF